jgi:hypothetical protein
MTVAPWMDGKRWIATAKDVAAKWGLDGKGFRCGLCGHHFKEGDGVRFQYAAGESVEIEGRRSGLSNFKVCDACDGPDVIEKWKEHHREFYAPRFWALR